MVFEGFWDLYCKKPATTDLTSKKLEGWLNGIQLKVNENVAATETDAQPEGDAEGTKEDEPATPAPVKEESVVEPAKAVVRVRVPFKRPEAEEGEAEVEDDGLSKKSEVKKGDEPLEEIEYEDKVLQVNPSGEGYKIMVVHQLA